MASTKSPTDTVIALLAQLQMRSIDEFDLNLVAEHLGIEIRYARLDGCAANIVGVGESAIVTVDQASSFGRRRYSVAHEIGHWIFDRGRGVYLCSDADLRILWNDQKKANPVERRANRFAAELLMPRSWFREDALDLPISFDTVENLRKAYQTSRTSTAIRLVELGSYLSMLIRYDSRGQRIWYCTSQGFPERMYPLRAASHDSNVWHQIIRSGRVGTTVQEVDGDVWIDHPRASHLSLFEQAIRVGDGFLVVISIVDESPLVEILEEDDQIN